MPGYHDWRGDVVAALAWLGSAVGWIPGHLGSIATACAITWYIMLGISWVANKGWKAKKQ